MRLQLLISLLIYILGNGFYILYSFSVHNMIFKIALQVCQCLNMLLMQQCWLMFPRIVTLRNIHSQEICESRTDNLLYFGNEPAQSGGKQSVGGIEEHNYSYLSYRHKLFYNQNIHINYQMDRPLDVHFHSPCEKDLRISYLEQYQLNGCHTNDNIGYQVNKQKTMCTLKDITDKYGFFWDEKGKLAKINQKKKKQNETNPKKIVKQVSKKYLQFGKENKQKSLLKFQTKQANYISQSNLSKIDDKINRIIGKYKKLNNSNKDQIEIIKQTDKYSYNKIKQIQEQSNIVQILYFGTQNSQDEEIVRSNNNVNRSKSQYKLLKSRPIVKLSIQDTRYQQKSFQYQQKNQSRSKCLTIQKRRISPINIKNIEIKRNCLQLDNKISSITNKIKECQKQKQQLKIQFKRFEYKSSQKTKTPDKNSIQKDKQKIIRQNNLSSKVKLNRQQKGQKYMQRINLNTKNISEKKQQILNNSIQQFVQQSIISNYKQLKEDNQVNFNLKHSYLTPEKQFEQKRNFKISLLSKLCRQLELDEQFRNAKLWFQKNNDPHKWGILADKLSINGPSYSYFALVQKFNCLPSEHNPFFSAKQDNQNYASLILKYNNQDKHWKNQLQKQFEMEDLEKEEFTSKQLDIQQKGYIKVQDLVRFVNMRTKNFYRTRDFILIFQRFAGKEKQEIHFSRILQVLIK